MRKKNIFIFDQNKCVACHACVVACINENGFQSPERWRNVYQSNSMHYPLLPLFYLSLACNHCDDAPCLVNCPALAYRRDEMTGAVLHDPDKCIGCKYCTWACPYDAPKYSSAKGIIEKCTFCNHRIEEQLKPACAELCPVGALGFMKTDFSKEESFDSSPISVDIGSNIKQIKLRNKKGPEQDLSIFKNPNIKRKEKDMDRKISAKKDRSLLIFTLLSALLVSIYASDSSNRFNQLSRILYLGTAALSAILSMIHLGKTFRSWRSLLNIRNSWLSREIALMILFYSLVIIDFYIYDIPNLIGIAAGLIFLYAIDMLYHIANWRWKTSVHSAQTLLIAFTFTLLLKELMIFLSLLIVLRSMLYLFRKFYSIKRTYFISVLRVALLIIPLIVLFLERNLYIGLTCFIIGEIIDRVEFYNELNVPDSAKEFVS